MTSRFALAALLVLLPAAGQAQVAGQGFGQPYGGPGVITGGPDIRELPGAETAVDAPDPAPRAAEYADAPAFDPVLYAVEGVAVDVAVKDPGRARDEGLAEALRLAWPKLIEQIAPGSKPPKLSDKELSRLMQDFELSDEKLSPVRYVGSFIIRFKPSATDAVLDDAGIAATAPQGDLPKILVVPVWQAEAPQLWSPANPWLTAWKAGGAPGPLHFSVPLGEIEDIRDLSLAQAQGGDVAALSGMVARYGADEAVVAVAQPQGAGLSIRYTEYDGNGVIGQGSIAVQPVPGEEPAATAVKALAAQLYKDYQAVGEMGREPAAGPLAETLAVSVPVSSLNDWLAVKSALAATAGVRIETETLGLPAVQVTLAYAGDTETLAARLLARGIHLSQDAAGVWTLTRGPVPPEGMMVRP